jgi:membrane-bound lytic murein transglycosylase MltF
MVGLADFLKPACCIFAKAPLFVLVISAGVFAGCQPSEDQPKPGERQDNAVQADGSLAQDQELLSAGIGMADLPDHFSSLWRPWEGDLDGMLERRAIRVLVVHSGYLYFFDKGRPRGVTAEMLAEFERFLNKTYETRRLPVYVLPVPVTRERLIPDLIAGRADLVAANLTITPDRLERVDFASPIYSGVNEIVVTGPSAPDLGSLEDLSGQDVFVRASSSYFESLSRLSAKLEAAGLKPPRIRLVEEVLEDEDVLEMVNAGTYPMTVVDDVKARFWMGMLEDIRIRDDLVLNTNGDIAWAFRKGSPELEALLSRFMKTHGQGTLFGNVVRNKYLDDSGWVKSISTAAALERFQGLSSLFKKYAEEYDFDWLELAAQAYQESGFDNDKRSPVGAVGIMQVKPSTAADRNIAVPNVTELENNIHAGAKYMRFLADRYFADASVHPLDQWLLAVAAYNAGPAKIARMRKLAVKHGYDPTVWFDNVEVVVARNVGRETVTYVSNIYKYYLAYKLSWERSNLRQITMGDQTRQSTGQEETE